MGRMDCVSRGTDLWWMWSDLVLMKYAARTDARPYREHGETDVFQLTEMGREVGIRWRTLQALKEKGEK